MITLRRATPADCEQIARLHEASIRGLGITSYTPEQVDSWASHLTPERYLPAIERNDFLLATIEDEVVGFGELNGDEIAAVYISPTYARRGIGRMLTEELLRLARERGIEYLHLNASMNGVPFYEAIGFTAIESTTWHSRGGLEMPCLRMGKRLR